MKKQTISVIGWYGVLAILTAYILVTFNFVTAKSYLYQLLNLTGALGLITEAFSKKDVQPVALNAIWAVVALIALMQLIIR